MAGMEGMFSSGFVGRLGRKATGKGWKKKAFGDQGTDFGGFFKKDEPSKYAGTHSAPEADTAIAGEPNKKGVRKKRNVGKVNSVVTPTADGLGGS